MRYVVAIFLGKKDAMRCDCHP